jgi:hypothetical protein
MVDTAHRDILINLASDAIFVLLVALLALGLYWIIRLVRLAPTTRFFGLGLTQPGTIYVSGYDHEGVTSRRVVTALEYDAAVRLRDALRPSPLVFAPLRFVEWLAQLVALDIYMPDWEITVAPLESVEEPPL